MPEFKYKQILREINDTGCNCYPDTFQVPELKTYRYIFEYDTGSKNHLPNRMLSPKRKLNSSEEYCSACGLSSYDSQENATNYFNDLINSHPNIYKNIGDSLAVGELRPEHGTITTADEDGHFDFYEYINCDPHSIFNFVQRLV